ncbi:MAG TPA: ATP-binding cassette domain-containing protein [Syntrophorhabdaceae bacterium]|nr:ATP-binding cassette domain-containing protein [Syntrophorhabdaceae bacterium]HQM82908.1 ATP-binding cassette domain-containing protein [Syntrophorhabdaceae bacterium]
MAYLKIDNLRKNFGGVVAVDDVSFTVEKGTLVGIIGPNGSGKTTTVNLLTGFLKPSSGSIFFDGKEITGMKASHITNLGVGRTFQMVKPFYRLPAFRNLVVPLFSPRVKKMGGHYGEKDSVALDILEDIGFERDSAVPFKVASILPHGYLKRLEMGRVIALQSELIVFDELYSGLTLAEVASLSPMIEKLVDEGKTIIMVEHRLKELFKIANKVIVLDQGKKIAEGEPKNIMKDPEVKKAYLGVELKQ